MTGVRPAPAQRPAPLPQPRPVPTDPDELAQRALGWEIMRLRSAADLTRTELADRTGLSPAVVRRYEDGAALVVNLRQLRAIAAALGVTAGRLIDSHPAGVIPGATTGPRQSGQAGQAALAGPAGQPGEAGRSAFVLLPTRLPGGRRVPTGWRLVEYAPRDLAQRWERPETAEPGRTVSRSVLSWVSDLLHGRAELYGSAAELTGERSWYVGPVSKPAQPTTPTTGGGP